VKSALRVNKQESLAAVPVPRGLVEPPACQMENRPLSAEDLRQLSVGEFAASLREGVSKRRHSGTGTQPVQAPRRASGSHCTFRLCVCRQADSHQRSLDPATV
jgi:hypothetical protein